MKTDLRDSAARRGIIVLIIASCAAIVLGTALGSTGISFYDTVRTIFFSAFKRDIPQDISAGTAAIILKLRLPRVILAFLTGAAMSLGGAVTQSVLSNPLASPYTLGVSSGASVGAAAVMVAGITLPVAKELSFAAVGTLFGIGTVVLCVALTSRVDKNMSSTTVVLAGMVLSLFLSAVFTFVAGLSKENMTMLIRWQMGSFGAKGKMPAVILLVVTAVCFTAIMFYTRELDILSFGDETAAAIGVNVRKTKWILLILTAVLTSTAVSFSGVIGFIDLIAPHVARKLFSPKHKYLCVISALIGGIFMVIADLAARTIMPPSELPVGSVTAFIGAPFFAYVYFSGRRERKNA